MMRGDLTPNSALVPTADDSVSADVPAGKMQVSPLRDRPVTEQQLASSSTCRKRRVSDTTLSDASAATCPSPLPKESTTLQQMIHQERECRATPDHVALLQSNPNEIQNHLWRERVSKWCYDVLDYLEESRDVAHVAMNFLDRYLAVLATEKAVASSCNDMQPFQFEVLAFTALFLAIRVCGQNKNLQIPELLQLSSSGAEPRHIMEAGHLMLEKLSWDHRILTPHSFLKEFFKLFVKSPNAHQIITKDQAKSLLDFASYLVEVSVCDGYFSPCAPSHVAVGAFVVAMTCDPTSTAHQASAAQFFRDVREHIGIGIESAVMNEIISRLLEVYNQSHEASSSSNNHEANNVSNSKSSPHVIVDDNEDMDMELASSMREGVMGMEEIRSVSPSSLERIHTMSSGIFQVAE